MKGKVALVVAGALALLGVTALLSRRTDASETFNQDGQRPDVEPDGTLVRAAVDEED